MNLSGFSLAGILFFLSVSCSSFNKKGKDTGEEVTTKADTFIRDIPQYRTSPSMMHLKTNIESLLNISSLENGFDSLEIRIWYAYALTDKEQLVIIKHTGTQWAAQINTLTFHYGNNNDSILSISKQSVDRFPRSGWDSLMLNLKNLDFFILPDHKQLQNYHTGTDSDAITVEFATKNTYRIYTYIQPSRYTTTFKEAVKIENIMDLIEREFEFARIRAF
ncbi:MAG: hypothetical protein J7578_06540 [Chitinophagaceae bacterium]|nr:hypothetical protein [Chitinophagaceae bacterium]